ncbi:hypothetical protein QBC43DRAFT_46319 [Cladorrhinum sp. PSN259]|nr:hypothetical protein QBC43DRAFT_46319 [Cladorrhinum sp. PSN259]
MASSSLPVTPPPSQGGTTTELLAAINQLIGVLQHVTVTSVTETEAKSRSRDVKDGKQPESPVWEYGYEYDSDSESSELWQRIQATVPHLIQRKQDFLRCLGFTYPDNPLKIFPPPALSTPDELQARISHCWPNQVPPLTISDYIGVTFETSGQLNTVDLVRDTWTDPERLTIRSNGSALIGSHRPTRRGTIWCEIFVVSNQNPTNAC